MKICDGSANTLAENFGSRLSLFKLVDAVFDSIFVSLAVSSKGWYVQRGSDYYPP